MKKPLKLGWMVVFMQTIKKDLSEEEFSNAFIEFIEEKEWYFDGG